MKKMSFNRILCNIKSIPELIWLLNFNSQENESFSNY